MTLQLWSVEPRHSTRYRNEPNHTPSAYFNNPKMPQGKTHWYSGAAWTFPEIENTNRNENPWGIEVDHQGKGGLRSWRGMAGTGRNIDTIQLSTSALSQDKHQGPSHFKDIEGRAMENPKNLSPLLVCKSRTPESSVGSLIRKSSNLTIFLWTEFPDISQKSSGYGTRHRFFLNYIRTLHQA